MKIEKPGPVTGRITLLGRPESCLYHVRGDRESAVLGGGMSYIIPDVMRQMAEFGLDPAEVGRLVIHHAHFDHVALMPYFKHRWPGAKIAGSERAAAQLARPQVVDGIRELSRQVLPEGEPASEELLPDFGRVGVDEVHRHGDELDLGGLTLRFLETPGHSSCSMSVYIPEEKALSASDAGGIPYGEAVFASANSNLDQYRRSLELLAALKVEVYLAEHYGALTAPEACDFISRSIEAADATRAALEEAYRKFGDVEKTAEAVTEMMMNQAAGYFLPRSVLYAVSRQMAKFVALRLEQ